MGYFDWWISFYSLRVFPFVSEVLRILFFYIPFSVGDLLVLSLVIYLSYLSLMLLAMFLTRKSGKEKLLYRLSLTLTICYVSFYVLFGFNYKKSFLGQGPKYSNEDLINLCQYLLDKTVEMRSGIEQDTQGVSVCSSDIPELFSMAEDNFRILGEVNSIFDYKYQSIKPILIPELHSYLGNLGYYNPFTAEANVNTEIPIQKLPFVICHEKAHQIGIASESQANFIGFKASVASDNIFFRYSGYLCALIYSISDLKRRDRDEFDLLYKNLEPGVKRDIQHINNYFSKYSKSIFSVISRKIYDWFLKFNSQKEGIESYNGVVALLITDMKQDVSILQRL
ncbi:hypothetical protein JBKA6_0644 [Ichthyobacterium seriolicida]|uniref:Amino acid permease n=2 Tax=Ichthyobacterium seriolicida TaxID=242600 RepID=A0A1J1DXT9_9FLAO|nr:hypothetical protein JBKA6_0644 [Ichthyobacterium seriolicida]